MPVQYLKITAELNENINDTQTHNTFDFRIKNDKHFYTIYDQPAIFQYSSKKHGFTLPPTKLIIITTDNGKIQTIDVNPQMNLLDIDDAIPVLKNLVKLIYDAGWKPYKVSPPDTIDRLKNIFADKNSPELATSSDTVVIGRWQDGDNSLLLQIKKDVTRERLEEIADILGGKAKEIKYDNLYLITVALNTFSIPAYRK